MLFFLYYFFCMTVSLMYPHCSATVGSSTIGIATPHGVVLIALYCMLHFFCVFRPPSNMTNA